MWYQSEGPAGYGDCSDLIKVSIFRHLSTSTALVGTLSEKTVESTGYGDQMKTVWLNVEKANLANFG